MEDIKILIVEDEWLIGNDMQNSLEGLGYKADVVTTGEEAVQKVWENLPDLVLMDIMLRGKKDGIETAQEIRSFFDIPIIYVTAYADKDILQRARITTPFGYMLKPFNVREAHIIIEMAIYKHRVERQSRKDAERFSTTLASIGDAVVTTDKDGRVIFMNREAESLTGCVDSDV